MGRGVVVDAEGGVGGHLVGREEAAEEAGGRLEDQDVHVQVEAPRQRPRDEHPNRTGTMMVRPEVEEGLEIKIQTRDCGIAGVTGDSEIKYICVVARMIGGVGCEH